MLTRVAIPREPVTRQQQRQTIIFAFPSLLCCFRNARCRDAGPTWAAKEGVHIRFEARGAINKGPERVTSHSLSNRSFYLLVNNALVIGASALAFSITAQFKWRS